MSLKHAQCHMILRSALVKKRTANEEFFDPDQKKFSFVHGPNSRLHTLISYGDTYSMNQVQKIVSEETDSLCLKNGADNCFVLAASMRCAANGNPSIAWRNVKKLLQMEPAGHSVRSEDGSTLLMLFCDYPEAVEYLLENGSDPNAADAKGHSVLMRAIACQRPSAMVLDLLIRGGASLELPQSPTQSHKDIFSFALALYPPPLVENGRFTSILPALDFLFNLPKAKGVEIPNFYRDIFASLMEYKEWKVDDVFMMTLARTSVNVMNSPFFNFTKLYASPIIEPSNEDNAESKLLLCGRALMGLLDKDFIFTNSLGYFIAEYFKNCIGIRTIYSPNIGLQELPERYLKNVNPSLLDVEGEGVVAPALLFLYQYFQKRVALRRTNQRDFLSQRYSQMDMKYLLQSMNLLKGCRFPTFPRFLYGQEAEFMNYVPIELALAHLLVYIETQDECITLYKSLLAYSPVHPCALDWIDRTLKSNSANASFRIICERNTETIDRVMDYIYKTCGTVVGGIANTGGTSSPFFTRVMDKKSPASLKTMSIWASRMAIAKAKVSKLMSLPTYIKKLGERGILPIGLTYELLVFPPTRELPY